MRSHESTLYKATAVKGSIPSQSVAVSLAPTLSIIMASSLMQTLIPPPTQVDDTHKVYSIATGCIVLGIVASMFVLLRLGQRIYSRTFGNDDWAIIPALVSDLRLGRIRLSLIIDQVTLHRLDRHGCICESQCRSWQASVGDYAGGVFDLVQSMSLLTS